MEVKRLASVPSLLRRSSLAAKAENWLQRKSKALVTGDQTKILRQTGKILAK